MTYTALDCQAFAGGFTLGVAQTGFELIGKREMSSFGIPNCEANRHLLGYGWEPQIGDAHEWEPRPVDFVFGNPPCSGFSLMTSSTSRGADAKINHCMWAFAGFAARCKPQIAVFESVQQAVNRPDGYQLMRRLRETLEERSGLSYHLYHVKHDAYSLGGAAVRKRYFWVVSQIPFGIDPPKPQRVPLLRDVISDLEGLDMTWHSQPVRRPPSWWAEDKVRGTVDGHHPSRETSHRERVYSFVRAGWAPRETMSEIARRYYLEHGKLPIEWQPYEEKLLANDFDMGFRGPWRWSYDRAARVITGGALDAIIHPVEDRFLTHREAARVMGFPDDWNLYPLRHVRGLETNHGKGITVQCGSWIASWVKAALDGNPSDFIGEETGEREHTLNFTRAHWPISSER